VLHSQLRLSQSHCMSGRQVWLSLAQLCFQPSATPTLLEERIDTKGSSAPTRLLNDGDIQL
jgi:hypothetical protein